MKKNIYTAIVFYHFKDARSPEKYRNIINTVKFEAFILSKAGLYINYYLKDTKEFYSRKWLSDWK
jgi:hypothetical protein